MMKSPDPKFKKYYYIGLGICVILMVFPGWPIFSTSSDKPLIGFFPGWFLMTIIIWVIFFVIYVSLIKNYWSKKI